MSKINLHEMFETRCESLASLYENEGPYDDDYQGFKDGYTASLNDLQGKIDKLIDALEFYSWIQPTQFPEGYYEPHYSQGQGGHDRFGTRARQILAEFKNREVKK